MKTAIEQDYHDFRRTATPDNIGWINEWIAAMENYRIAYEGDK